MKISLTILMLIISTTLLGQKTGYCQGCCGCITPYYFILKDSARFEIFYTDTKNTSDFEDGYYGKGTYKIENKIITLSFEDIPRQQVIINKTITSDSLIVRFDIKNNLDGEIVNGANVTLQNSNKDSFVYDDQTILKTPFKQNETISVSFAGFQQQKQTFTEPGVYEMRVMLGPLTKYQFEKGETKRFKIIKTLGRTKIKDLENKKLKFTTRNCGC